MSKFKIFQEREIDMSRWGSKAVYSIALACLMTPYIAPAAPVAPAMKPDAVAAGSNSAPKTSQADQEIKVLKDVAQVRPTDKTPWLRMTQIKFDAGNYGDAVTYALEVLQRDPADKFAKGIVALGSLKLSIKALNDLSAQNNLNGTVLADAQNQAKMLRESLGETGVVSAAAPEQKTTPPAKKKAVRAVNRSAAPKAGGDTQPFSNLQ
ncbi:hypothetical protein [Paraherbaspirillum soli]|uniref:Tetratricopeptide repeat protein n=1 Tax=Paraherbaspirillum soli TaxID=631222 RepID=A0ABW0MCC2_9BURK